MSTFQDTRSLEPLSFPTTSKEEFKVLLNHFRGNKSLRVFLLNFIVLFFVGSGHANPGEPYSGLFCTSYLPNNPAGQEVCSLLKSAFEARLMFTIDKSAPAAGDEGKIICNGIELQTNRGGGPANHEVYAKQIYVM